MTTENLTGAACINTLAMEHLKIEQILRHDFFCFSFSVSNCFDSFFIIKIKTFFHVSLQENYI